jgi:hypothetical protein
MEKSGNKIKTMWSIINERTNKKMKCEKYNVKLQINDKLISEPELVANTFNDFFASIGENRNANATLGRPVLHPSENTMFLAPVNYHEVHKLIKNLKNKNSHGVDELPPSLLRQCADQLTVPFCVLINQSFDEGRFPDLLKKSLISPIHKKNSKTDPNNYRPIALLPTASKIFEKAMCNRIYKFCEKYNKFDSAQNGFRKNRSTTLAVYRFMQQILDIVNSKQYAVGILLDMTKAYDKVQYSVLLSKLYGIGIRGIAHRWLTSYLQDREQFTELEHYNFKTGEIKNVKSDKKTINASIPQGSVIGCLLFLIYINDLPKVVKEPCVLFADDISILTPCQDTYNLNEKITSILQTVSDWLSEHNLQINFSKTKLMSFHPTQKEPLNISYTYNNIEIEVVDKCTLLGIVIDKHICWKPHVQNMRNKISKFVYALRQIKKTTDLKTALQVYYSYAYNWLSYGAILWANSTDAPSLFILQKKLIRILANIKQTDSCKDYFKQYNILTLPCIDILEICKFVRNHPEFYTKREDVLKNRIMRYKGKLMLPSSRLKLHSSGPLVMSIKNYNKLP